ncbi:hypothetical protein E2986_11642 [Frieseomelitta varia]|uniref:Uncharacterized protein n=1 Tax=Frieseomelitta varia TaxID=561572 RepID=A0A833S1F8_9HYME|nr:hypothetical protein E2986_11642 [Frieseomelitta varia]
MYHFKETDFTKQDSDQKSDGSFFLTFRHGFPHQPTAVAFDPVQRLLAIGTKSGSLRIYPIKSLNRFKIGLLALIARINIWLVDNQKYAT